MVKTPVAPQTGNRSIWSHLKTELREEIVSGRFAQREQLPSENDLAELFGVHRHTVRKVIRALESEGLLRVQHGSGTFVNREFLDYHIGVRTRFTENVERQGLTTVGQLLASTEEAASGEVAKILALKAGEQVVRLDLLRHVEEQPVSFATHFLPAARFKGIAEAFVRLRSLTSALKHFGIEDYVRVETVVVARLPTDEEARHLNQTHNSPIFELQGHNADVRGKVFLYSVTRMSSLRVQLRFGSRAGEAD
ncbi:phosphonate metabolism transcriptional regulator PhnF [Bradyrhizobium sp. LHD-71]|uniref:phosphonate metabolism transcriptional regulator PhnF n=1 Tax=Bradyrhizobium sp. LHD-71 TaxID=3072141 RepID=UPI00280CC211|nr:phosphonate metabolism transcriptional regulator PhnF [Bradyrhizobium sp. LHD-71]MDQ8730231.1 phosphonate metabolism transcriptional regulator PhnF [Bradyrhizobium sp. LHD-71]